jgi:chromosomal replication initiator protein
MALARGDSAGTSPLVLFGPSGVGKSRLLAALAGEWHRQQQQKQQPHDAPALLTSAEGFAASCALARRDAPAWAARREAMRSCRLFLLDDLLALARTPQAARELVFTLDALDATGAAVAVAASQPPSQWVEAGLPPRLVGRLSGGLTVALAPPGDDLKRRYALEAARQQGLTLSAHALDAVVVSSTSFPAVDGALARLAIQARLGPPHDPTDPELPTFSPPTIESVLRAVSAHYRVPVRDLRAATRRASVVEPRHLAMHLAREWTGASFLKIARAFGGRDPATVRHACRAAASRIATRPDLAAAVEALRRQCTQPGSTPPPEIG